MNEYNIKAQNITKRFGSEIVIDNFTCDFMPDTLYLINGASGRGKTTLLRILAGLDRNFSGILDIRGKCSVMFQEHRLFPSLSAVDNILELSFEKKDPALTDMTMSTLSSLGFSPEDMKKYPDELSGGMKQRISFARALLFKSDILILDEPFKELDENLRSVISDIILDESKHRTVIVSTHEIPEIFKNSAINIQL